MRAWRVHAVGDPSEVLRLADVEPPIPGPTQVAVAVDLAPINFPDHLMITGRYQVRPDPPFTPGLEVLGHVVRGGSEVKVAVGSRVLALTSMPAGGFAQEALAEARDVFIVPNEVPDLDAAAMLIGYQTAHIALHHRAGLRSGETLLVHAGAGGVGSAAIQLGVVAGARVIATAGGAEKIDICRRLGAHQAIDYVTHDFAAEVLEATDGRGADVVFDPVGGDVFHRSRKCIAWEGRLLVIGFAGGRIPEVLMNHVLLKNYSIVGVHWGAYRDHDVGMMRNAHEELMRLYRAGHVKPLIGAQVPLERLPAALESVVGRRSVGRVMVRP